ncbi:MAG: hypothetical protein A2231_12705 [Candidatus Firestonebacteria bacterium RIFOXYA2_FULL_40_8]|nr:MAG: hypothetical protein A2231_12705 [Candidatus Firestonebacteria bacterium RIFOXYA2_FULL_40_8]
MNKFLSAIAAIFCFIFISGEYSVVFSQQKNFSMVLSSFEQDAELGILWDDRVPGLVRAKPVEDHVTEGKKSLRLNFKAKKTDENGIREFKTSGLVFEGYWPFKWFDFENFKTDVFNDNETDVILSVSIGTKGGWYKKEFLLPAKKDSVISISFDDIRKQIPVLKNIVHSLCFTIKAADSDTTLYLDNIRLESVKKTSDILANVRVTWQDNPKNSMTISWQTTFDNEGIVEYGIYRNDKAYTDKVKSSVKRKFPGILGVFHTAKLTNLTPGMKYHYRCGDGFEWNEGLMFNTEPEANEPFVFCAGADTKWFRKELMELLNMSLIWDPKFVIYPGDAVTVGRRYMWDLWFDALTPFASGIPVMPSTGNHELSGDPKSEDVKLYCDYNAVPEKSGTRLYYSFDYGNVHFVSLETELSRGEYEQFKIGDEQIRWLQNDLAKTDKKWKVVFCHSPLFSSGTSHGSDLKAREMLCPIFDKYKVNLVFGGDDHCYERSKSINISMANNTDSTLVTESSKYKKPYSYKVYKGTIQDSYKTGTCYMVSAGMTAQTYNVTGNWWTAFCKKITHISKVTVENDKMTVEAVDLSGNVFDKFVLEPRN